MIFRVQTDEMNAGLGLVTHATSARGESPLLEGVLIESDENGLLLTCTDGDMSIKARVNAAVAEEGCTLLPARLFSEVMRRQPAGEVEIRVDDRQRAVIKSAGSNTNMTATQPFDYPDIADVTGERRIELPCQRFKEAIGNIMFAVSSDENRKILTGVLLECRRDETLLVGLDGFRLALQRTVVTNVLPGDTDVVHCVVPGRVLSEIGKMLPDGDETAVLVMNGTHLMCETSRFRVYTTLLTGEFIDYNRILPQTWTTEIHIMRDAFNDAIERCSLIAREGKNNLIYLKIDESGLMEMTANAEMGTAHETIEVGFTGAELEIAFNARYLTDVVHHVTGDSLVMCFNSNVSPCMVKPPEGNEYTYLVLPVRVFG